MKQPTTICLLLLAFSVASCTKGASTPLQEDLSGVRVLGVAPMPLVPTLVAKGGAGTTATLTVYVSVPTGNEVTLTPGTASGGVKIAPTDMTVGAPSYTEHAGFRLATIVVTVPVPSITDFPTPNASGTNASGTTATTTASGTTTTSSSSGTAATANDTGSLVSGNVSYEFTVNAGSSAETADGSFLAAGAGNADLAFTEPTLTIYSPQPGSSVANSGVPLQLADADALQETVTTGWYVTDGEVDKRTEQSTSWTPGSGGNKSVIGTVRGARSHGFAIQVIDVDVE